MSGKEHEFSDTGILTLQTIQKASGFNKWMYGSIKPFLFGEVLEIGSGIGNISQFAIQDGFNITLSDVTSEYCEILRKKFLHHPNVTGVLSIDLQHPDFFAVYNDLKGKFDTIFLLNVIEHLEKDSNAISNCYSLLKKNGNLIVLAPSYPFLYCRFDRELGHFRRYTLKSLGALFNKSLFKITSSRHFNFAGTAGWFLFGKVLNKKIIGDTEMSAFEKFVPLFRVIDHIFFNKAGLSIIITGMKK